MVDTPETSSDEVTDWTTHFAGLFGSTEHVEQRLRAERRAGLTPKQRQLGKGSRTIQVNFRSTPETKALAEKLADHLDCSIADAIEKALRALAKSEGVR